MPAKDPGGWLDWALVVLALALGLVFLRGVLAAPRRRSLFLRSLLAVLPLAVVGALLAVHGGALAPGSPPQPPPTPPASAGPGPAAWGAPAVVLAAGDIASCASDGDEATAELLDGLEGTLLALGDIVYEDGTPDEYAACYDPTWGRHKDRTRPVPGNHEYGTAGASGYFGYFGAAAGEPGEGYYSFDLGGWHVVVLNSVCAWLWGRTASGEWVDGCAGGSPQERWLRADLAAHPAGCTLVAVHQPRFSSGSGTSEEVLPLWEALYAAGADVVLSGDAHQYERFAPQDPWGTAEPERGIRQFVVGTGGRSRQGFQGLLPNSEAQGTAYGVLALRLHPGRYEWRFLPVAGETFSDAGSARCH